jgi:hypothetical protein
MTNNPERDLELYSVRFVPREAHAYNPTPIRRELDDRGRTFAKAKLLARLERTGATAGSPFFTTFAKIGRELTRHRWGSATVISVGDGLVVDRSPDGRSLVRLDRGPLPTGETLREFVPMLKSLRGSCVILIGQGATDSAGPRPERIRAAEQLLGKTLNRANVGFVSTRSRQLPPRCADGRRTSSPRGARSPKTGSSRQMSGAGERSGLSLSSLE